MLDLSSIDSVLDQHHHKFQDSSLPPSLSREAFARFDASVYPKSEVTRGRLAWEMRVLDEYRSQVAFTELLMELTELGCAFDVLGVGIRVVRDEARHVELCRRMVLALGGGDVMPGAPGWIRSDTRVPLLTRILRTASGFLCIGETLSVKLILAVRQHTSDPLAKEILTSIAADESIHGFFGFKLLELINPLLSEEQKREMMDAMPAQLGAYEKVIYESGGGASAKSQPAPLPSPFGSLPVDARMSTFRESMENDIIPKFEALGFPVQAAWNARPKL
jgi:hypothetical protein